MSGPSSASQGDPFKAGTGWFYHYVREAISRETGEPKYPATPFRAITARIAEGFYTDRGVSNLMIYGPYFASAGFRGLPAIDHLGAQVGTGSVDDFRDLVTAAHDAGITVTVYVCLLYVDPTNERFVKAEADVRDGADSFERGLFRWAADDPSDRDAPPDFGEVGGWAYSDVAGQWYATSWEYPALDYARADARTYAKDVLRFWLETGIDGIEYDYPPSLLGVSAAGMTMVDPAMTDLLITTPTSYSPNVKWLHAEGAIGFSNEEWSDQVGFTHILINGDEDTWSFPYAVMDGGAADRLTVDDLESHWQRYFDLRRQADPDRGVNAWSLYVDMSAEQRALDAAVQAGMGALYSIDHEEIYALLTPAERDAYDDVFRALKSSPALVPAASRVRRPASTCEGHASDRVYAVERTSPDGSATVLNVYNFTSDPQCVRVDLSASAIRVPQTPVDLGSEAAASPITSDTYDVHLPPFGYAFLDVATG